MISFVFLTTYYLLLATSAYAVDPPPVIGTLPNPLGPNAPGFEIGVIQLLNNVLRLSLIGAGIYTFLQLLVAGLKYSAAAGDPQKIQDAWTRIWQSLLGLIIMIVSFIFAVLVGAIFFGDPTIILNPKIPGAGG